MSILRPRINNPLEYTVEDLFSLSIWFGLRRTKIIMVVLGTIVNTHKIPSTYPLLNQYLPQIFLSKCFNDAKLPFKDEVRHTEIGHLFEHILLEYLCVYKFTKGYSDVVFSGETSWNWRREPYGLFHINVNSGYEDLDIFPKAFEKTIVLMSQIMGSVSAKQSSITPFMLPSLYSYSSPLPAAQSN